MKQKTTLIDWVLSFIAVIVVLGVMGSMDSADQEQSAKALEDTKKDARAEMLNHKREMAALDARARYMTGFDQLSNRKEKQ